jgi:hypothetical protein
VSDSTINRRTKRRKDARGPGKELIACVIRQYGTGLYRTCVSLDKKSTICLSTHQDEASATEMINRFLEAYRKGQIKTLEEILVFIDSIRVNDSAAPLPVRLVPGATAQGAPQAQPEDRGSGRLSGEASPVH